MTAPFIVHRADSAAFNRSARPERIGPWRCDQDGVPSFILAETGIRITGPFAARLYGNNQATREALVVLHRFGPPIQAEAEIVVYSARFSWPRAALADLLSWAAWTVGAMRIVARIPATNAGLQHLAHRAGFMIEAPGTLDDGSPASIWALPFDRIVAGRFSERWTPAATPPAPATHLH